jgi:hypothetical protein
MHMPRHVRPIALLCAGWLAACNKEAPKTDSTAVAQSGAATARAAGYDPDTRVATAIAKDFAFLAPDTVLAGWTTFRLLNDGETIHHMQIVRLDSGKTASDFLTATKTPGPLPKWAVTVGGPNVPDPKSESNVTIDLPAGQYVLLCFVDTPDKVPHFAKGMVRPLTVAASNATGTEPVADVTVALTDYAFTVKSGTLSPGKHTVKVVNDGPQEHEIELVRFAPGKSTQDLAAWLAKMDSPPPASALGGVAGNIKGGTGYFTVDLVPGNYAFLCFAPDAKDGKTHLEHGMVKEFVVQ